MNAHQSLAVGQPIGPPEAVSLAQVEPDAMVRFAGISKTYPAYRGKPGVNALQDIDFAIPRGSITGVIGRSGAGKSSLVRLINGLEKPTTGRVIVDDKDISALSGRELRLAQRSIGMIFQQLQPAVLANRRRQHRAAARDRRLDQSRHQGSCRRTACAGRHRRQARPLSFGTLRRPEAARRHRASPRHAAERAVVGRGDFRARSADHARDPRPAGEHQPRTRRDHRADHPRNVRGPPACQGSGGARCRPHRRERPCRRHLHPSQACDHADLPGRGDRRQPPGFAGEPDRLGAVRRRAGRDPHSGARGRGRRHGGGPARPASSASTSRCCPPASTRSGASMWARSRSEFPTARAL